MIEEAQIICKTVHLLLCICVLCTVQEAGLAHIIDECFSVSPPASLPLWMRIFLWTVTRRQREVTRPTRAREQRVSAGQERGRLLSRSRAGASCLVTRSETARLVTRGAMCTCLAMYETPLVYETPMYETPPADILRETARHASCLAMHKPAGRAAPMCRGGT